MKEIVAYEANDGTVFSSIEECIRHDRNCLLDRCITMINVCRDHISYSESQKIHAHLSTIKTYVDQRNEKK